LVSLSVGILTTSPVTPCGLASFSASLATVLAEAGDRISVVPVDGGMPPALDQYDVVVVPHDFHATDDRVPTVLDEVHRPVIAVLPTVLTDPSDHQREMLERVVARADAVVTMTVSARDLLIAGYRVDAAKISVIPHGAVGSAFGTGHGPRPSGAPVFLTWGLLSPGQGIESAIDAFAQLRHVRPSPRYRVVGPTHPRVLARDGEAYRQGLIARAAAREVDHLVSFDSTYLEGPALTRMVASADVVILPYESRDEVTSSVLIEAVAAGKPVVATAFPHAVELLSCGAGLVVPHDDPAALARALRRMLIEPRLVASMRDRGAEIAPELLWPAVAARYRQLAADLVEASVALVG
jgi:glycosyltransferase involved in cell wall biosynthesis